MTELEQLKQEVQELTQRIEELENAKGVAWVPKVGEKYFFQNGIGVVEVVSDDGKFMDKVISIQRVYPTLELAEANDHRKEKIAVWNKFREMETEAVDWANNAQRKFLPVYDHDSRKFKALIWTMSQHNSETEWYTTSLVTCEWVIANMQTELKKIWGVS